MVVLLLFAAAARFPALMGDVAQGIKAFKKGMSEDDKTAETPSPSRSRPSTSQASATKTEAERRAESVRS